MWKKYKCEKCGREIQVYDNIKDEHEKEYEICPACEIRMKIIAEDE